MKWKNYSFSCFVLIAGLALWLTIAAFNNLTDPHTNRQLLAHTLTMRLISDENNLGMGLVWRALPESFVPVLLYIVVAIQASVSIMLWRAAFLYFNAFRYVSLDRLERARDFGILALTGFQFIWLSFICGGLWLGYWLKQGAVQSVHLMLIIIGVGMLLYVANSSIFFLTQSDGEGEI